jgi:hypothetical protein
MQVTYPPFVELVDVPATAVGDGHMPSMNILEAPVVKQVSDQASKCVSLARYLAHGGSEGVSNGH